MTIEERVKNRVANGATFLDCNVVGWADRIDLERLRMSSCLDCIFGQLFGSYSLGIAQLDLCYPSYPSSIRKDLGFISYSAKCVDDPECDAITAAWRSLILARRAAQPETVLAEEK